MPTSEKKPHEVIVLDDQKHWLEFFHRLNRSKASSFTFRPFNSYEAALSYLKRTKPKGDVFAVFVDVELGSNIDGIDFVKLAREEGLDYPYIICSQYDIAESRAKAEKSSDQSADEIAYFVSKDDIHFEATEQNVDEIAKTARQNHLERVVSSFRRYFEGNATLVSEWRSTIARVVAELDTAFLESGHAAVRGPSARSAGTRSLEHLDATLRNVRGSLSSLAGVMQVNHVLALQGATGKAPETRRIGPREVDEGSPNYQQIFDARSSLQTYVRPRTTVEAMCDRIATTCRAMTPADTSIALASLIDTKERDGRVESAVALARASADYFKANRDIKRQVAFMVVAADMLARHKQPQASEALLSAAKSLARASGDASTQLELTDEIVNG
jgi:hypothetical protein